MGVPTVKILAILVLQCAPPLVIYWILATKFRRQVLAVLPATLPFRQMSIFLSVFLLWLLVFYGLIFRWVLRVIVTP